MRWAIRGSLSLFGAPNCGMPTANRAAVQFQKRAVRGSLSDIVGVYHRAEIGFAEVGGGGLDKIIKIGCERARECPAGEEVQLSPHVRYSQGRSVEARVRVFR